MGMKDTVLIAISTPISSANFFSRMITMKDPNGDPVFRTLHVGLVCEACKQLPDARDQLKCKHMEHKIPQWKSSARQDRVNMITVAVDPVGANRGKQENMGEIAEDHETCFFKNLLDEMQALPHYVNTVGGVSLLFVTIDPNSFGDSLTAIISGYFIHERGMSNYTGVVLGVDAERTTDVPFIKDLVQTHIQVLRHRFPSARIVIIAENTGGNGYFASDIEQLVSNWNGVAVLHEDGKEKPGVNKTKLITMGYVKCFQEVLKEKCCRFDSQWFTTTHKFNLRIGGGGSGDSDLDSEKQLERMKAILFEDLERYGVDEKGHITGKFGGYPDDRTIAFLMFHFWGRVVLNNSPENPYRAFVPASMSSLIQLQREWIPVRKNKFN